VPKLPLAKGYTTNRGGPPTLPRYKALPPIKKRRPLPGCPGFPVVGGGGGCSSSICGGFFFSLLLLFIRAHFGFFFFCFFFTFLVVLCTPTVPHTHARHLCYLLSPPPLLTPGGGGDPPPSHHTPVFSRVLHSGHSIRRPPIFFLRVC